MSPATILHSQMQPLGRLVRAYFAPVDRNSGDVAIFDPAAQGMADLDAPPAPWISLGEVSSFRRSPETAVQVVRQQDGGVAAQYRTALDAAVECEFERWGKVQMAVAGGAVHFNVLACSGETRLACGGKAIAAAPLLPGSTTTQLLLDTSALTEFAAGDLVAVDVDYAGQCGYVGSGVPGAYVATSDGTTRDMDFVRRVTFNVARVSEVTDTALLLASPLPGGAPLGNAGVQRVVGFVDREGGSFFQEWSAVFVMPEDSGGRIVLYYPRLQSMMGASESARAIAEPLVSRSLHAKFRAMPVSDSTDGELVVCYRSYFPARTAPAF